MVREILLGIAKALGMTGEDDDQDSGCDSKKQEHCREQYGRFFDGACQLCPDNPNKSALTGGTP